MRMEALFTLYKKWCIEYVPVNNLEHLLREHMIEMYNRIYRCCMKEQKNYAFSMTGTEAIAFCLTWGEISIDDHLQDVTVREIINQVDRKRKNAKRIGHETYHL